MSQDTDAPAEPPAIYLREWRLYRGLTQAQVQKRFGWAEGRLSKLESGSVQPKPATLRMLARLYGCEFNDLFGSPPEIGDAGLFGVLQLQRLLAQARQDIAELKTLVIPRIEAIEGQLAQASTISVTAAQNADELATIFARYAARRPPAKSG